MAERDLLVRYTDGPIPKAFGKEIPQPPLFPIAFVIYEETALGKHRQQTEDGPSTSNENILDLKAANLSNLEE